MILYAVKRWSFYLPARKCAKYKKSLCCGLWNELKFDYKILACKTMQNTGNRSSRGSQFWPRIVEKSRVVVSFGLAAPARAAVTMVIVTFQAADDEQQSCSGTRPLVLFAVFFFFCREYPIYTVYISYLSKRHPKFPITCSHMCLCVNVFVPACVGGCPCVYMCVRVSLHEREFVYVHACVPMFFVRACLCMCEYAHTCSVFVHQPR